MKINIKRVYEAAERGDGSRVLVDRLWPRGTSKDKIDLWLKDIAPSNGLRNWYGHVPKRWASFRAKYRRELASNPDAVKKLKSMAKRGTVTLLYGARDTKRNQAIVIANFLKPKKRRAKTKKAA